MFTPYQRVVVNFWTNSPLHCSPQLLTYGLSNNGSRDGNCTPRPPGYEPDELLLLYSAMVVHTRIELVFPGYQPGVLTFGRMYDKRNNENLSDSMPLGIIAFAIPPQSQTFRHVEKEGTRTLKTVRLMIVKCNHHRHLFHGGTYWNRTSHAQIFSLPLYQLS